MKAKMKVLVTGVKGQLGHDVMRVLAKRWIEAVGVDKEDFDITDTLATHAFITSFAPTVVVHCSAYTAVDKAEDDVDICTAVNVQGTRNIAKSCKEIDARMVYISTDYVFPGLGERPYEIDDEKGPLGIYGKTKLEGEFVVQSLLQRFFIIRTAWVFGTNGNNFVKTMLRIGKDKESVNVVSDQIGSPTYTYDLARLICDMIETDKYGVYHATNEGYCSWSDFASEIFLQAGYKTRVNYITSDQYPSKAHRPANSRLSMASLDGAGFCRLPKWQDALARYLHELKEEA